jgi:hypothetical protein
VSANTIDELNKTVPHAGKLENVRSTSTMITGELQGTPVSTQMSTVPTFRKLHKVNSASIKTARYLCKVAKND